MADSPKLDIMKIVRLRRDFAKIWYRVWSHGIRYTRNVQGQLNVTASQRSSKNVVSQDRILYGVQSWWKVSCSRSLGQSIGNRNMADYQSYSEKKHTKTSSDCQIAALFQETRVTKGNGNVRMLTRISEIGVSAHVQYKFRQKLMNAHQLRKYLLRKC